MDEIIDRWRDGEEPRHPLDAGVFGMCDKVASDLDAMPSTLPHDKADEEPDPDACSNPGGHEWNRSAAEADEARVSGDFASDSIRCIHCGADGDS